MTLQRLLRLPLRNLRLVEVPQLVDAGRLASRDAFGQLNETTNSCSARDRVLCSLGLDPDDANAGILWATVVLAVTKIADPSLQRWRVVLPDNVAAGLDRGMAGDGGPLARVVDEANVDRRVLLEVICLARLGVGVEEEIKSIALLSNCYKLYKWLIRD